MFILSNKPYNIFYVDSYLTLCNFTWQALLKKHEALMSDLDAYGSVIDGLREQAKECKVSLLLIPPELSELILMCLTVCSWLNT